MSLKYVLFSAVLLTSCGTQDGPSPAAPVTEDSKAATPQNGQPETTDALVQCVNEIVTAIDKGDDRAASLIRDLLLPEHRAWFARTFREPVATRAADEYEGFAKDPARFEADIRKMFEGLIKDGRTVVAAERVEQGAGATGLQNSAFEAMLAPIPLYTIKMGKSEPSGFSLWSFVHADGRFRLLGKMRDALRN